MPPYDMESSSSLIMGVIRILSNSKDDAERDVIRKKLEDCLAASDQKLTKLVSEHHKDLRSVMQTFTKTANNLQMSMDKLKQAKQRLVDSKETLTSKLEELKKLSEELKTSEKMLSLLDQVDTMALDDSQAVKEEESQDSEFESTLIENNVFNPRTSENTTPSLFKFSRSSYAICFEDHFRELSI
jgi:phenylalanyl-tRNA synthetase alpha subunit